MKSSLLFSSHYSYWSRYWLGTCGHLPSPKAAVTFLKGAFVFKICLFSAGPLIVCSSSRRGALFSAHNLPASYFFLLPSDCFGCPVWMRPLNTGLLTTIIHYTHKRLLYVFGQMNAYLPVELSKHQPCSRYIRSYVVRCVHFSSWFPIFESADSLEGVVHHATESGLWWRTLRAQIAWLDLPSCDVADYAVIIGSLCSWRHPTLVTSSCRLGFRSIAARNIRRHRRRRVVFRISAFSRLRDQLVSSKQWLFFA